VDRSRDETTDLNKAGNSLQNGGNDLALVLSGGGARAAYQVGLLRTLAKHFPNLNIPILTGVSAGAINAAFLANHRGSFTEAVEDLTAVWRGLTLDQVFRIDSWSLMKNVASWGARLAFGGSDPRPSVRGLVDTAPLCTMLQKVFAASDKKLTGIGENLRQGRLKALAITGTNYGTGQAVTWVQGKNIAMWERPYRHSAAAEFAVDHIMASAALPLFFPAIEVDGIWYGDGGIRQSAPLSPALHLGAKRILAISTRYECPMADGATSMIHGYPPPAQIIGALMNSIFLDVLDQDARALQLVNHLLEKIPDGVETGSDPIDLFMLRPSCDIGKISGQFESRLPGLFRHLGRSLGTNKTNSPDWLSMVMFEPHYITKMLEIGEADAQMRLNDLATLLDVA